MEHGPSLALSPQRRPDADSHSVARVPCGRQDERHAAPLEALVAVGTPEVDHGSGKIREQGVRDREGRLGLGAAQADRELNNVPFTQPPAHGLALGIALLGQVIVFEAHFLMGEEHASLSPVRSVHPRSPFTPAPCGRADA